MTGIITEKTSSPPPADKKDGAFYDRCPSDGCLEVDRKYKNGGRDGKGEDYLNWSYFHADPREGGCGTTWTRTTKQGAERDRSRGVNPKWLTRDALVGSFTMAPSEAYRFRYDHAFGKCGGADAGCIFCLEPHG